METFLKTLAVVGVIETIILIVGIIWAIILWTKGIFPALLRLGNGLAKRRIVIFGNDANANSLKQLLLDSKLFNGKNIDLIANINDVERSKQATLFLVYWPDWSKDIDSILQQKEDGTALIVYAPRDLESVPEDVATKINNKRNSLLTNFRGRLLNDVITSMITTGYSK